MKRYFRILCNSPKDAIKAWRQQYGLRPYKLADGRDAAAITRKLEALKRPTKEAVDKIIGDNGWTDIWCCSCKRYKHRVASFGDDETAEVCVECLEDAATKLSTDGQKKGTGNEGAMTQWEYITETVNPGESWYDVLRARGLAGWEAWHIEKNENGWRDIYFKRPRASGGESHAKTQTRTGDV